MIKKLKTLNTKKEKKNSGSPRNIRHSEKRKKKATSNFLESLDYDFKRIMEQTKKKKKLTIKLKE